MPGFFGIVAAEPEIPAGAGRRREEALRDAFPIAPNTASMMRCATSAAQPATGRG
jgi:hypothetical protein